jgi:hypothetical protein
MKTYLPFSAASFNQTFSELNPKPNENATSELTNKSCNTTVSK